MRMRDGVLAGRPGVRMETDKHSHPCIVSRAQVREPTLSKFDFTSGERQFNSLLSTPLCRFTMTEDITSSPQQLRSMSQSVASPGPLHVSDLAPASNPPSRPRKLEPLQQRGSERVEGERDKKTRRKKTRRRAVEVGEVRGDLEGQEDGGRSGSIREERGPLHDVSLLKDMRARLDPLYNGSPSASLDGTYLREQTTLLEHNHHTVTGSYHDAGGGGEREEMQSKGHTETATSEQETEEQRETQQRKKKRRRRRRGSDRESGSGVSDTAIQQQDTAVDKQQTVEPEVMSSVADPSLQGS